MSVRTYYCQVTPDKIIAKTSPFEGATKVRASNREEAESFALSIHNDNEQRAREEMCSQRAEEVISHPKGCSCGAPDCPQHLESIMPSAEQRTKKEKKSPPPTKKTVTIAELKAKKGDKKADKTTPPEKKSPKQEEKKAPRIRKKKGEELQTDPTTVPSVEIPETPPVAPDASASSSACDNSQLLWERPIEGRNEMSAFVSWKSTCGRYAIARVQSMFSDESRFSCYVNKLPLPSPNGRGRNGYGHDFKHLSSALQAVEDYHKTTHGISELKTNAREILSAAEADKTDELPRYAPSVQHKTEEVSPPVELPAPAPYVKKDPPPYVPIPRVNRPHGKRGTGILATVCKMLLAASAKKPATREDILAKLLKEFPDRDPRATEVTMKTFLRDQLNPKYAKKEMKVSGDKDKGYYAVAK